MAFGRAMAPWSAAALGIGMVLLARARAQAARVKAGSGGKALWPWAGAAHQAVRALGTASPALDRAWAMNPVHGVAAVPTAAALCTAAALGLAYLGERRRRPFRSRRLAADATSLDVVSAAGAVRLPLARDRAQAVWSGEGQMVAQVVWSHDLGWCATAPWPHHLVGADGLPCRTAALGGDHWVRVTGVRLRLYEGAAPRTAPGTARRGAT